MESGRHDLAELVEVRAGPICMARLSCCHARVKGTPGVVTIVGKEYVNQNFFLRYFLITGHIGWGNLTGQYTHFET